MVFGEFQNELTSVFGDIIGWLIGHVILFLSLGAIIFGIRERNHIMNNSGLGRSHALDLCVFLLLTAILYSVYTTIFQFESGASLTLAATSSLSLRWMVTVLG
tara:strand:+ start:140 stop:448 length:309 start_codon:yes stop_codon:yes gene_type:complete